MSANDTTASLNIDTTDVALFPIVGYDREGSYGVIAVAYVRISGGKLIAGVEGDCEAARHEPLTYADGDLNSAIRYASSIAGHDLDVRPEPAGHGY